VPKSLFEVYPTLSTDVLKHDGFMYADSSVTSSCYVVRVLIRDCSALRNTHVAYDNDILVPIWNQLRDPAVIAQLGNSETYRFDLVF